MIKIFRNKLFSLSIYCRRDFVVLLLISLLAACSSSPDHIKDETKVVTQQQQTDLGPYQQNTHAPSVVTYQVIDDPLRFINEPIFSFNDVFYEYLLTPFSKGYQAVMPEPIDQGIRNFFNNLSEPVSAINHLFQGEFKRSANNLSRLLINSTIGLFGMFDPASHWFEINVDTTGFAKTIERYGVGRGAYLVLPFIGPSNVRGLVAMPFDQYAHPLNHINDDEAATQLLIINGVHRQIPVLAKYPQMLEGVDNRYEFIRNLYIQGSKRDQEFGEKPLIIKDKNNQMDKN